MKTLESIFIEEFEALKNDLYKAEKRIKELENQEKEVRQEKAEEPVVFKTFSKETCYLKVKNYYDIEETSFIKEMTSNEVKEIVDDDEKLKEYAQMKCDRYTWSQERFVSMETDVFPYSSLIQGHVILLKIYGYDENFNIHANVLGNKNKLKENKYFDIKEKERLYDFGLGLFKEQLMKVYKRKLEKENSEVEE